MSEQTRVKIVCPECGGPLPPEAATVAVKCARCGHASAPVVAGNVVVGRPCPRCKVSPHEGNAHGVLLLGCGVCGGIFLDNEGSTRITRAPDAQIARLAERARDRAVAFSVDTRPKNLPCPLCAEAMRRVVVHGFYDVDFCPAHGTWFDGGELTRVMQGYAPRPDPLAADARSRAEAEARMAAFRESQRSSIDAAETTSMVGAFGLTLGMVGILGALVAGSD